MVPDIRYTTTDAGIRIAYSSLGEGTPLIHMPDIPVGIDLQWDIPELRRWYESLARRHRLIVYDPPGVGLSDRNAPDVSYDPGAGALEAVAAALDATTFDLFSGYRRTPNAIRIAATRPELVERLILWCPYSAGVAVRQTAGHRAMWTLFDTDWQPYTEYVLRISTGLPPPRVAHIALLARASITRDVYRRQHEGQLATDVTPLVSGVRCPTLVIHRRDVSFVTVDFSQQIAAQVQDGRFVTVGGESMYPYFDEQDEVLDAIERFLNPEAARQPFTLGGESTSPVSRPGSVLQTVLFTDLEGHTEMMTHLGDERGRAVLRDHERITRDCLRRYGGIEVKTMGDGFMASFPSAQRALDCAIALQEAVATREDDPPLRVRVGINAGEPIAEDNDLFGASVIVAARIAARALGGQVLVANVVRELVAGKDYLFSDTGEHMLKGFDEPTRVWELRSLRIDAGPLTAP